MAFCKECGKKIGKSSFCSYCGFKQTKTEKREKERMVQIGLSKKKIPESERDKQIGWILIVTGAVFGIVIPIIGLPIIGVGIYLVVKKKK